MTLNGRKDRLCSVPVLLNQFCHQRGPAGLVAGADAGAVVAVEIFVEGDQISEVRVGLKLFRAAKDRTAAVLVA